MRRAARGSRPPEAPLVRTASKGREPRARLGLVFLLRSRTHKPHTRDGGDRRSGHASFAGRHAKTLSLSANLFTRGLALREARGRGERGASLRPSHTCHDASVRASSTSLRRLTRSKPFSRLTLTLVPYCGTTSSHAHQPSLLAPEFAKRGGDTLLNHLLEPCCSMASSI
jgi:hypothetical protein